MNSTKSTRLPKRRRLWISLLAACLFLLPWHESFAQNVVSGTVFGPDNKPLEGVSVTIEGTTRGTTTDVAGRFTISLQANKHTLVFSLVGYQTVTRDVSGQTSLEVSLSLGARALDEVVITGYSATARDKSVSAATTVSAEKINQVPMTIDQTLQGRVPGLVVSSGSGQPGQSAKVTLRGVGTIEGNSQVLYVIDGVPVENGYFQTINPSDVENVTVLKDASAKALYGSRGSNGVIVITTKRGKQGKVTINYQSQYGFSNLPTPTFKMMNADEHLRFEEEIGLETGDDIGPGWTYSDKNPDNANLSDAEKARNRAILDSLRKVNTDWRDLFFRRGRFMEQQVSAAGGNERVRFYTSLNYYDQQGIAVRSDMQRLTLRNNMDFTANKFKAGLQMSLGYSKSNFIESEGGSSGTNPLSAVYYALPYEYPYAPDGTLVHSGLTDIYPVMDQREGTRAYELMLNSYNRTNQFKTTVSGNLEYEILPGLSVKGRAGLDMRQSQDEAFIDPDSYSGSKVSNGGKGSFGEASRRNIGIISNGGITYANKVNAHDFEVSGLYEYLYNNYRSFGYTGYGLEGRLPGTPAGITPGSPDNGFIPTLEGGRTENALASWIAFGRYTYAGKYTLNATFRYDGSSTVPVKNRWHEFYSVGLNWDAKMEDFLKNVSWLSNLRFRTSYGTTASPFGTDFGYIARFGTTSYGGEQGIIPVTPGNKDYDWEYAKEWNVGADIGVLNNRVRLIADVYNRKTYNLFFDRELSITSGFNSLRVNGGSVSNKGIELDLQGDIVRTTNIRWTVGGNIAFNKNKVTGLDGADEFEIGYTGIIRVGLPLGSHYAPEFAGVNPETGAPQFYTKEGEITEKYSASALSVAKFGSYIPGYTGGFNTSFSYKGLYLNALFSFVGDVMRYNNEMYYNENPSFISSNQSIRMLYDRWKKPGDKAVLPGIEYRRRFSSFDIYDASYLRLRNVTLGYQLPGEWLGQSRIISKATVFVQGENLYTWTKWIGFDPENGNEYNRFAFPNPRTYTAGINIQF